MTDPERSPHPLEAWPELESTETDRPDDRPAEPSPVAGPAAETGEFTPVPPTKNATDRGGDGPDTAGSGGGASPAAGPSPPDTEPPVSGDPTADFDGDATTPPGRDETASYRLAPGIVPLDTERIVPSTKGLRGRELPRIAGYEILEVLGRGGMGIVYKARQTRLDRFVALKMIRAGTGARPSDLIRFEAEARAVAAIDHPNIIKIFEIGEHDGLPYFSLEFLAGGSLAKRIEGKPQPVEEAAQIVETLARAMAVAHARGIVHRDIKPANVLLAPDGTPKIADFGLVKRLEADSGQTREGSILGSPSYMAPEQAAGADSVGPAADQYALGATLYELLTGRPPFRGTSALDTIDLVRTKEPVPPSQLLPRMPRDLETICLKCLQKDPARRYADVAALADDLRRFRAAEPIVARPISDLGRAWRWCLRNKRLAVAAALSVLLLIAVAFVSVWFAVTVDRKNHALDRANIELTTANEIAENRRVEAEKAQRRAEDEQKRAVLAGQAAIGQNRSVVVAQRELIGLLELKLRDVPALQPIREKVLDQWYQILVSAADSMAKLREEVGWPAGDEELNWRTLALAHQRIGELRLTSNQLAEAEKEFRLTNEIIARLAAASPDDLRAQVRLLRSHRQIGDFAQSKLGDFDEALRRMRQAVELARSCVSRAPNDDFYKNELANSLGLLARAERELGHLARARDILAEETATRESYSPARASKVLMRRELSGLYEQLFTLSLSLGDLDAARRYNERSAEIREQIVAEEPELWAGVYDLARVYNNLGMLRFPMGTDPARAREYHQKAIALIAKWVAADPLNLEAEERLAEALYYEATCALKTGDRPAAAAGYRRCREIREKLATDPKFKMPKIDLMVALARCGDHARAAAIARELVAKPPDNELIFFHAACGFALAAGAVRDEQPIRHAIGGPLLAAVDSRLIRSYADQALDCLRKGKDRGWTDVVRLETDPDLEPIRDDPAFRALLAEFPRPAKKRP